jgi:hypothetical protein
MGQSRVFGDSKWTRGIVVFALTLGTVISMSAAPGRIATLEERFTGADRVVLAKTRRVSAAWRRNEYGDRMIVTRALVDVDETLKGAGADQFWLEVEGGTIDGVTLEVSSVPLLHEDDRAIYFLNAAENNLYRPFLKGQGILTLDGDDMVRGSSLHLNQIRSVARSRR